MRYIYIILFAQISYELNQKIQCDSLSPRISSVRILKLCHRVFPHMWIFNISDTKMFLRTLTVVLSQVSHGRQVFYEPAITFLLDIRLFFSPSLHWSKKCALYHIFIIRTEGSNTDCQHKGLLLLTMLSISWRNTLSLSRSESVVM